MESWRNTEAPSFTVDETSVLSAMHHLPGRAIVRGRDSVPQAFGGNTAS